MAFLDNDGVTRLTGDYLDIFARKEDAVLDPSGGLIRTDDGIKVDSLVQESDGEVSGAIAELTAKGHAEQFTTTGKNLLMTYSAPVKTGEVSNTTVRSNINGSGVWPGIAGNNYFASSNLASYSVSRGSVTFTNKENLAYGVGFEASVEASTTYNVSAEVSSGLSIITIFYQSDGTFISANSNRSFTTPSNCAYVIVMFKGSAENTEYTASNIQLELGSAATAYEPYTGGAPSPSPDYPQEIQVVRGRNLLQLDDRITRSTTNSDPSSTKTMDGGGLWPSISANGYVISNVSGVSVTDGVVRYTSTNVAYGVGFEVILEPETTYVVSFESSNCMFRMGYYTASGVYVTHTEPIGSGMSFVTPTSFAYALLVLVPSKVNVASVVTNIQLELGSTPQPYVPYGHVGMEVQGKNLLDEIEQGGLSTDGINTSSATRVRSTHYMSVSEGNDYVVSGSGASGKTLQVSVYWYTKADYSTPRTSLASFVSVPCVITAPTGSNYVRFLFRNSDGSNISPSDVSHVQFEKGSTATDYEPCFISTTPIPLPSRGWVGSLPDGTADTLTLDGAGKVEWEEKIWKAYLDESKNWENHSAGNTGIYRGESNRYAIYYSANGLPLVSRNNFLASICDRFIDKDGGPGYFGFFRFNYDGWYIFYDMYNVHTLSSFKTWLSTHPVTVLYPLATPVTEHAGYVDMPAIPSDATVTIPELDALGIKYFVDDSSNALAKQWHERIDTETDDKITANNDIVESNIAMIESSTAKSNHAVGSYFMLDNVLHKATSAIASGETITSGSNATPITLEQAISTLNSSVASLQVLTRYINTTIGYHTHLDIVNPNVEKAVKPESTRFTGLQFCDRLGRRMSFLQHYKDSNGDCTIEMILVDDTADNGNGYNGLKLVKTNGVTGGRTLTYNVGTGELKTSSSGGTLGNHSIVNSHLSIDTSVDETKETGSFALVDTNGTFIGRVFIRQGPTSGSNTRYLKMEVSRKVGGTVYYNSIDAGIDGNGSPVYGITNAANFRAAIGAAASSDRRLKSDVSPLEDDAVEFINALEPVVYTINGERQVGLIAQDVHDADPWGTNMAFETRDGIDGLDDWEKMPDGSPTWKLDYIRVIAPLVATVKAQDRRIAELERLVEKLTAGLD